VILFVGVYFHGSANKEFAEGWIQVAYLQVSEVLGLDLEGGSCTWRIGKDGYGIDVPSRFSLFGLWDVILAPLRITE